MLRGRRRAGCCSRDGGEGESDDETDSDSGDEPGSFHATDSFCKRLNWIVKWHCEDEEPDACAYFWYCTKWFVPACSFCLCFFVQCYCLHIATYFYIKWMMRLEQSISGNSTKTDDQLSSVVGQGSLHDLSALLLGYHEIPTAMIDTISGAIPVCWFVLVVHSLNLHLFCKCCLCGSLLALGKGCLAVVTVVPDSIGWTACKRRLGPEGIAWFVDDHNVDFRRNLLATLQDFFWMELYGSRTPDAHNIGRLRFCADMIYSGHTYVAALFSLGLYDFCKVRTRHHNRARKCILRTITGLILSGIVLTDAFLMLLNQFHYTLDIMLAILLSLLFYTNAAIARTALWWADEVWVRTGRRLRVKSELHDDDDGDVLIPPCCVPFCLMSGRFAIVKHGEEALWHRAIHLHTLHLAVADPKKFASFMEDILNFHASPTSSRSLRLHRKELRELEVIIQRIEEKIRQLELARQQPLRVEELMEELEAFHGGSPTLLGKLSDILLELIPSPV